MKELLTFPDNARFRIIHRMYVASTDVPKDGDLVIDRKDGAYGRVEMLKDGHCAVTDGYVAEVGVPVTRLIKLIPVNI